MSSLVDTRDVQRGHADKLVCLGLLYPTHAWQWNTALIELITQATGEEYERLAQQCVAGRAALQGGEEFTAPLVTVQRPTSHP
ncbi:MAG: hypothetical protein H7210_05600 [Pyrinomonadaceae bacterium]|nr:hypothetical protein [Phycisphaerales bacterium]